MNSEVSDLALFLDSYAALSLNFQLIPGISPQAYHMNFYLPHSWITHSLEFACPRIYLRCVLPSAG